MQDTKGKTADFAVEANWIAEVWRGRQSGQPQKLFSLPSKMITKDTLDVCRKICINSRH